MSDLIGGSIILAVDVVAGLVAVTLATRAAGWLGVGGFIGTIVGAIAGATVEIPRLFVAVWLSNLIVPPVDAGSYVATLTNLRLFNIPIIVGLAMISAGGATAVRRAEGIGPETEAAAEPAAPAGPVDLTGATAVSAGVNHALASLGDGTIVAWGNPDNDRLGDGVKRSYMDGVGPVRTAFSGASAVAAGENFSCAIRAGGVACWGKNDRGQLGDGSGRNSDVPVNRVSNLTDVTAIAAGNQHACALTAGGTVYCWGLNNHGQLGNGTTRDAREPVAVAGVSDVAAISAGREHTCAVTRAGSVYCWGRNKYGELGTGNTTDSAVPVRVAGIDDAVALDAGADHTVAARADGSVMAWGRNFYHQLGDGTNEQRATPVAIDGLSDATAVAAGHAFSCALRRDGTVVCWGGGAAAMIGRGGIRRTGGVGVATVPGLEPATSITAGDDFACAVLTDGRVMCWGANVTYGLGDGSTRDRNAPVTVIAPALRDC